MYKLFNIQTRETNENQFLSLENANNEAQIWSESGFGIVAVIDTETGLISNLWDAGWPSYIAQLGK